MLRPGGLSPNKCWAFSTHGMPHCTVLGLKNTTVSGVSVVLALVEMIYLVDKGH